MKKILALTLFSISFSAFSAYASNNCRNENRDAFLKINQDLYNEYSAIDKEQIVTKEKEATWIEGDPKISKALFLAHGYMGTPSEMMFIAQPFIKAGWTVVGFLIPGHGSSYTVSDAFKNTRWQTEMARQLPLVTNCFEEVRVVGFSTGGLLLHDYLLNHPTPHSLKSVHLVSPYFVQKIGTFFDWVLKAALDGISVDTAYTLTRFPDLRVMTIDRKFYNQNIPVGTALEVKDLGLKIYNQEAPTKKLRVPVQLFLSEGDWTVNTDATKKVLNRDALNVELIWYKGDEPHHLMAPSVSGVAKDVQSRIFNVATKTP